MRRPLEPLPHEYPFRFVDRVVDRTGAHSGRVRAAFTTNSRRAESGTSLSPLALGEMIAQAALLLQGQDPASSRRGFLAGFTGLTVERVPEAGDLLTVEVGLSARLGPAVRFEGTVWDDAGRRVARGAVTVRTGSDT